MTRIISYDDSAERRTLAEEITRLQAHERCVKRATCLMLLLAGLATAGIFYAAVFMLHPENLLQFLELPLIKVLSAVALSSIICMLAFQILASFYRVQLAKHRDQCRTLAMKLLETRLNPPMGSPIPIGVPDLPQG